MIKRTRSFRKKIEDLPGKRLLIAGAFCYSPSMAKLHSLARAIRHAPVLQNCAGLWNLVRPFYHRILDWRGKGVQVVLSGILPVRMPPRFLNIIDWEHYEPETMEYFVKYVQEHPGLTVLDMGCSFGIFTAAALFSSEESQVIAWDGDIGSIQCLTGICSHASHLERLHLVHGFASTESNRSISWNAVIEQTSVELDKTKDALKIAEYKYLSSANEGQDGVPVYSIDHILLTSPLKGREWLFKCDIEGAELLALKGASQWLSQSRPAILLSVHPELMKQWGHTPEDVENYLIEHHYSIQKIDEYYNGAEQSWWCLPQG